MWERIGASSGIIVGAAALFVVFVAVLFLIERYEKKAAAKQKRKPYLLSRVEKNVGRYDSSPARAIRQVKPRNRKPSGETFRNYGARKIV